MQTHNKIRFKTKNQFFKCISKIKSNVKLKKRSRYDQMIEEADEICSDSRGPRNNFKTLFNLHSPLSFRIEKVWNKIHKKVSFIVLMCEIFICFLESKLSSLWTTTVSSISQLESYRNVSRYSFQF